MSVSKTADLALYCGWNYKVKVICYSLWLWIMHASMVNYRQRSATLCRLSVGGESLDLVWGCLVCIASGTEWLHNVTIKDRELPHHCITIMKLVQRVKSHRKERHPHPVCESERCKFETLEAFCNHAKTDQHLCHALWNHCQRFLVIMTAEIL